MKNKILAFIIVFLSLFTISNAEEIGVTILPLQYFVDRISENSIEVNLAVPQGSSPESYEPSPIELNKLSKSDIYFSIGMPIEDIKIKPFLSKNTKILNLKDELSKEFELMQIDGNYDPHIWLDPDISINIVNIICDNLSNQYPENNDKYKSNAEILINEINNIKEYGKEKFKNIRDRKFVAFHPAFQYFAKYFGLEMYALESNGKEATILQLEKILNMAKENNIKAIFIQNEVASRQADAFAEAIGGKVIELNPLDYNYIDNMQNIIDSLYETLK